MRATPKTFITLFIIFVVLQAAFVCGQESDIDEQRKRSIARRWDYKELKERYLVNGPKAIRIIERCYPHEIDTLMAMGDAARDGRKWGKANLYYEIILMGDPDNLAAHYGRESARENPGEMSSCGPGGMHGMPPERVLSG